MKKKHPFSKRARGDGYFRFADTKPYAPRGVLLGQGNSDSCVPAYTRMLILDYLPDAVGDLNHSEAALRFMFQTDEQGSIIARIPKVLRASGVKKPLAYRTDLTIEQLRESLWGGDAIVVLRIPGNMHVVIVEQITADSVAIRDPLPPGRGSAYVVALRDFLTVWEKSGQGSAVIVES